MPAAVVIAASFVIVRGVGKNGAIKEIKQISDGYRDNSVVSISFENGLINRISIICFKSLKIKRTGDCPSFEL